jgi:DNA invertase Pin-like site-specific DNA recombinase
MPANRTRLAAVLRVSTSKQVDSGLGLQAQREAIAAFAKREGFTVVSEWSDEGVSGGACMDKRPGLSGAVAAVLSGEADFIVVAKMDRLSRDPLCQMTIERLLAKKGSRVLSAAGEGTEDDSPAAVLMRRILSAVSENEKALVSVRTKAALAMKKARGERLGRPPFGFCVDAGGNLALHPVNFTLLHTAVEMSENFVPQREIASILGCSQANVSKLLKRWKVGRRASLEKLHEFVTEQVLEREEA